MRHKAKIGGHFVHGLRDAGQDAEYLRVDLARVCLPGDRHAGGKAHLLRDTALELVYLFRVAVEERQKACAGAGGALAAEKPQVVKLVFEPVEIHYKILEPQARPLSRRGGLRRLEMRVRERRHVPVPAGEIRQRGDGVHEERTDAPKPFPELDDIGVVPDVAARRAEVDDGLCPGAGVAVGADVRHHVVAQPAFVFGGLFVVDVINMRAHFGNLVVRDGKPQLLFALREGDPELPPGGEFEVGREDALHFPRGISGAQGVFVDRFVHGDPPLRR